MIKFFRKIRQNLLTENKTGKYLKYAFGEIILVIIGILIALQINNLNEERKTNNIKQTYYQQILVDIHKEKEYVERQIERLNKSVATYEDYRETIKNPNLTPIEIVYELDKVSKSFNIFNFKTKSIETLESTGDIKLMPQTIRNILIDIKLHQDFIIRQQNINDQHYVDGLTKTLQLGFRRLVNSPANFQGINLNDNINEIILTLEGALGLKNYTEKDKIEALSDLLVDLDNLKEMIDEKIRS